jgi:alpha-L-fucosidase 2
MHQQNHRTWYKQPAGDEFTEAIPIGNGMMGAMIYGNVPVERISLNEGTVWSGGPGNNNKPGAHAYLGQVRQCLFRGDYITAEKLVSEHMIGYPQQSFLPVGNLRIHFEAI